MVLQDRRNRKKEQRREDILRVTREMILTKGVDGFTLRDVANGLDISKATLYLSFAGKDDLLREILMEAGSSFLSFLTECSAGAERGLVALIAMGQGYFDFYRDQEDAFILFGLMDHFAPEFPFVIADAHNALPNLFIDLVRETLDRGVADGSLDPELDTAAMTTSVVFMITSLVDKVSKIPRNTRVGIDVVGILVQAFILILRAVAHPAIPRNLLEKCFEPGGCAALSPYWRHS